MTTSLRERAAQAARPAYQQTPPDAAAEPPASNQSPDPELDEIDLGASPADVGEVPVHVAWVRVMGEIREIRKSQKFDGAGTRYNFRGVDPVMNVFGAAQRKHGVIVAPVKVEPAYRDTKTSKGTAMRECTVLVTYEIIGPRGDRMSVQSAGESLDTGDKGTAKAMSVALRTLLLQTGMVPTEAQQDPDQQVYERGEAQGRSAVSYRDEVLDPGTSVGRIYQIFREVEGLRKLGELVTNETGDEEPLGDLVRRVGSERRKSREDVS